LIRLGPLLILGLGPYGAILHIVGQIPALAAAEDLGFLLFRAVNKDIAVFAVGDAFTQGISIATALEFLFTRLLSSLNSDVDVIPNTSLALDTLVGLHCVAESCGRWSGGLGRRWSGGLGRRRRRWPRRLRRRRPGRAWRGWLDGLANVLVDLHGKLVEARSRLIGRKNPVSVTESIGDFCAPGAVMASFAVTKFLHHVVVSIAGVVAEPPLTCVPSPSFLRDVTVVSNFNRVIVDTRSNREKFPGQVLRSDSITIAYVRLHHA